MKKERLVLCLLVCLIVIQCYCFYFSDWISLEHKTTCSLEANIQYIANLCHDYEHGNGVTGSFCPSLCAAAEVVPTKCLSHKPDDQKIVLQANWKNTTVILKAYHILETAKRKAQQMATYTEMLEAFFNEGVMTRLADIKQLLSECDSNSDGLFTEKEAMYCWHMHDLSDIRFMMSLAGNPAIPILYGTCGNMIAIEYASNDPLVRLPITREYRSWNFRAKMSVALIEMVERLEETKDGPLYQCDFLSHNFGFIKIKEQLIAKSIDNDISKLKNVLDTKDYSKRRCSTDSDCHYHFCESSCNTDTGKCSGLLSNNNLQLLCKNFLGSKIKLFNIGLLYQPPPDIQEELSILLHQCAYPTVKSGKLPNALAEQLKNLLKYSII